MNSSIVGMEKLEGGNNGRVERASVTEMVDSISVSGRVEPKSIKIGIHNFPA